MALPVPFERAALSDGGSDRTICCAKFGELRVSAATETMADEADCLPAVGPAKEGGFPI